MGRLPAEAGLGVGRCNIAGGLKDTLGLEDRALAYDCALVNAFSAHACQLQITYQLFFESPGCLEGRIFLFGLLGFLGFPWFPFLDGSVGVGTAAGLAGGQVFVGTVSLSMGIGTWVAIILGEVFFFFSDVGVGVIGFVGGRGGDRIFGIIGRVVGSSGRIVAGVHEVVFVTAGRMCLGIEIAPARMVIAAGVIVG